MKNGVALALVLAALSFACGDTAHRPIPSGAPVPRLATPLPATPPPAEAAPEAPRQPARVGGTGRGPLEISAVAVEGHPPLPTYHAKVKNVSPAPVRRVIATVVYLDAEGRPLAGENHDVAFGSPLRAIDPGVTLETSFLSRVERAPGVRLVVRTVVFLDEKEGSEPVPREWTNPGYEADLAEAEGRR